MTQGYDNHLDRGHETIFINLLYNINKPKAIFEEQTRGTLMPVPVSHRAVVIHDGRNIHQTQLRRNVETNLACVVVSCRRSKTPDVCINIYPNPFSLTMPTQFGMSCRNFCCSYDADSMHNTAHTLIIPNARV